MTAGAAGAHGAGAVDRLGVGRAALATQDRAEVRARDRVVGPEAKGLGEGALRADEVAEPLECQTQVDVGAREVGTQPRRLGERVRRLLVAPLLEQDRAQLGVDRGGLGLEPERRPGGSSPLAPGCVVAGAPWPGSGEP